MEKILIIEDDRKLHKPLQHAFETEGYSPDFAADGAAGLEAFRAAPPVLVVLDLQASQGPRPGSLPRYQEGSAESSRLLF